MGRFGQVLGFLTTQPETSGFEKTQPATRIKTTKSAGFQVGQGGLDGAGLVKLVGAGRVEHISLISLILSMRVRGDSREGGRRRLK
jgi:hypothetical protein